MRMRLFVLFIMFPSILMAETLDKVVAVVNDDVITSSELQEQVTVLRKQLDAKKVQLPPENVLRKQVLQHLIDLNIELQLAKKNDVKVDNEELDQTIEKIAQDNHLTVTQLREALSHQGLPFDSYRDNIRKEMLVSRLQQKAVGQDITVSAQQVDDYMKTAIVDKKKQQTYHLQNIVVPLPEEPTSEQVKKAQDKVQVLLKKIKQGADFSQLAIAESSGEYALEGGDLGERHLAELPDVFAQKVLDMQQGQVSGPIRTGNGYQLIKLVAIGGGNDHHVVTKTHARHILLRQDANMTEEEAIKQINNIYQQLKSGKDFAVMAKQYSVDSVSAANGGDLGWVTEGELVPQFAKMMKESGLNVISKPFKTAFGWHILQVLDRKEVDDSKAFQHQQVHQFLQQKKFTEAVQNWQQHLRAEAYVKVIEKDLA